MNAIFFGCKRAFHSCMRIARQALGGMDLTPARFDMFTAIGQTGALGRAQKELRALLGVSAATISRMLCSLEDIGLVVRTKNQSPDRRLRWVALTASGLRYLRKATHRLIRSGAIQLAVDSALTDNRAYDESRCLIQMDLAESILRRLRDAFGDVATLQYPWHPDD